VGLLTVMVLCGLCLLFGFMFGGALVGLMASRGHDARYEESKLKKCPNCGHYMLKSVPE
jgi:hypothetical protein